LREQNKSLPEFIMEDTINGAFNNFEV
jgi:hypothetical protein